MKKTVFSVVAYLVLFMFVQANEWKLSEVRFTSGKGAFTSGLDGSVFFASSKNAVEITGNSDRAYGVFFWKLPSLKVKIGICVGPFKNMIQFGPYVVYSPTKSVSAFYWRGWGFGKPNCQKWEVNNFFEAAGVYFTFKGVTVGYTYSVFLEEKTHLPGISYAVPIGKNFKVFGGVDYTTITKESLFRIGVSYTPKK